VPPNYLGSGESWQGEAKSSTVPEYLTIDEVCELLQLGKRTVYELARTGRLPGAAKVGGQWRVNRHKLMAWLEDGGDFDLGSEGESGE